MSAARGPVPGDVANGNSGLAGSQIEIYLQHHMALFSPIKSPVSYECDAGGLGFSTISRGLP